MARSFYGESKRVRNDRIKRELGIELAYPTYREGLKRSPQAKVCVEPYALACRAAQCVGRDIASSAPSAGSSAPTLAMSPSATMPQSRFSRVSTGNRRTWLRPMFSGDPDAEASNRAFPGAVTTAIRVRALPFCAAPSQSCSGDAAQDRDGQRNPIRRAVSCAGGGAPSGDHSRRRLPRGVGAPAGRASRRMHRGSRSCARSAASRTTSRRRSPRPSS